MDAVTQLSLRSSRSRSPLTLQRAAVIVLGATLVPPFEVFVRGLTGESMKTVLSCSFALLFFCSPVTGNVCGCGDVRVGGVSTSSVRLCGQREAVVFGAVGTEASGGLSGNAFLGRGRPVLLWEPFLEV